MTNIFDTHAHYSSRQFDADRDAVMRALGEGGVVGVLECATHSGDAAAVLELAHKYPFVHAALGIHPESLGEEDAATVATYHGDWRVSGHLPPGDLEPLYGKICLPAHEPVGRHAPPV